MRKPNWFVFAAILGAFALLAAACGGGDDEPTEDRKSVV